MPKRKIDESLHRYEIQLNMPDNRVWATVASDKGYKPDVMVMRAKTLREDTHYRVMDVSTGKVVWTSEPEKKESK